MTNRSGQRAARGRPAGGGETRRNRVVTLVTDSELQNLHLCADKEHKSISGFVHEILREFLAGKLQP